MLQVQNHILGTTVLQNSEQSHQSEVGNFPPPPFAQPRPLRTGAPLPTKLLLLEGSMQHALGISPFTPPPLTPYHLILRQNWASMFISLSPCHKASCLLRAETEDSDGLLLSTQWVILL